MGHSAAKRASSAAVHNHSVTKRPPYILWDTIAVLVLVGGSIAVVFTINALFVELG